MLLQNLDKQFGKIYRAQAHSNTHFLNTGTHNCCKTLQAVTINLAKILKQINNNNKLKRQKEQTKKCKPHKTQASHTHTHTHTRTHAQCLANGWFFTLQAVLQQHQGVTKSTHFSNHWIRATNQNALNSCLTCQEPIEWSQNLNRGFGFGFFTSIHPRGDSGREAGTRPN